MKKNKVSPPGSAKLWVVLPDIHFPDQDNEALEAVKSVVSTLKPDHCVLLGDVLDCGVFSRFPNKTFLSEHKDSYFKSEVAPAIDFLQFLEDKSKSTLYYLEGNHEQRIERWAVGAGILGQSIFDMISPQVIFKKYINDIKYIPYEVITDNRMGYVQIAPNSPQMQTGGLVAVHGWSWAKAAAKVHLEKSRTQSIVFGHVHRMLSEASRDPWSGKPIMAWSPGTLSKLQPLYATGGSPSDWIHGFSLVYVGKTSWTQYTIPITKGRCVLPDGREIKI